MPNQRAARSVEPPRSPEKTGAVGADAAFRLAAAILDELERRRIAPTARNYELWLAYRSGTNPALGQRMDALLARGEALSVAALDTVHGEFLRAGEIDLDAFDLGSAEIYQAAKSVSETVSENQQALVQYGDTLAHWAHRLGEAPSVNSLVTAVATLTAETGREADRNRVLEQQLAAAVSRINKLRQSLAEIKEEATTDKLTGLYNRRAFDTRIKGMMTQLRGDPSARLSLLILDVDHFKKFNDLHGHQVGDLVLRLVGRLLADSVKGRDTAARYGGEEFAILLAGADLKAGAVVAQQIGTTLSSKRLVGKNGATGFGHVTVSIGVAQARAGESPAALVARADAAMYEAKKTGRNRVCVEARRVASAA